MQQPPVAGVDHHHVHPAQLGHLRCIAEAIHNVVNRLLIQGHIIFAQMARAITGAPNRAIVILGIGTGSGMN